MFHSSTGPASPTGPAPRPPPILTLGTMLLAGLRRAVLLTMDRLGAGGTADRRGKGEGAPRDREMWVPPPW
jgi:hypothetical protein